MDWLKHAKKNLIGKTITDIRYMTDGEAKELCWEDKPLIIIFNDGSFIYSSIDGEGNNGGFLFGQDKKGKEIFFPAI
jgi:hypothetical protein